MINKTLKLFQTYHETNKSTKKNQHIPTICNNQKHIANMREHKL